MNKLVLTKTPSPSHVHLHHCLRNVSHDIIMMAGVALVLKNTLVLQYIKISENISRVVTLVSYTNLKLAFLCIIPKGFTSRLEIIIGFY